MPKRATRRRTAIRKASPREVLRRRRCERERTLADIASIGRGLAAKHERVLDRIEAQTGVPGRILIAIWGRESGFGRVAIPHDAFEVIGTLAFMGGRSPEWFRGELVAALKIVI